MLEAVISVMRFWLDRGVDGLRLDAVPYLIEREGTICENLPETHDILKKIRAELDRQYPDRMLLAEANQWPADVRPYFGDGDECHMAFHFPLMPRMFMALRQEDRHPIVEILRQTPDIPENCQWAMFLRNHDELTLEMVTDEERDYMYQAYAADPQMRINVGIRRRLAPLMENSRRRIELLNSLLFSMPGTPVIYYGDEIGMGDNIYLGDRNGVRTPMQWTGDRNAGFSRADPARLFAPPIMDPVYGYQAINVEAQERSPFSLLNWMKRLIGLRKQFHVFGRGSIEFLPAQNRKVLAYVRQHEDDTILCVANLSRTVQPVELDLSRFKGMTPVEMLGLTEFPRIGELPYFLTLGGYAFYWFRLQQAAAPISERVTPEEPAEVHRGAGALHGRRLGHAARRQRPHADRARPARRLPAAPALVRRQGAADARRAVRRLGAAAPRAAAAVPHDRRGRVRRRRARALLPAADDLLARGGAAGCRSVPATRSSPASPARARGCCSTPGSTTGSRARCSRRSRSRSRSGPGWGRSARVQTGARSRRSAATVTSRRGASPAEQSNTSLVFGDRLFLKLFRRLETGVNPDFEIGRQLTERVGFTRVPAVAGAFEYAGVRRSARRRSRWCSSWSKARRTAGPTRPTRSAASTTRSSRVSRRRCGAACGLYRS